MEGIGYYVYLSYGRPIVLTTHKLVWFTLNKTVSNVTLRLIIDISHHQKISNYTSTMPILYYQHDTMKTKVAKMQRSPAFLSVNWEIVND